MYIVMYIGIVQCIGQRHRTKCYRYSDVLKWREIGAALVDLRLSPKSNYLFITNLRLIIFHGLILLEAITFSHYTCQLRNKTSRFQYSNDKWDCVTK